MVHTEWARWSGRPSGCAGPTPLSADRQGMARGFVHGAEFGVGDSYHVVRLEQDIFMAWGNLAGSRMLRFPAITAGLRRGSGPIRAPDSGDDTEFRGGPPPHAAGPINVRADPPPLSLPYRSRSSWTSTLPSVVIARLLLFSAHMTLTLPSQLKPLELPETRDDAPAVRGEPRHRAFPPNVLVARSGTAYQLYQGTERP